MRIALDAMGSDGAPVPEVEGALEASASGDIEVTLVGDEPRLRPVLVAHNSAGRASVVHASEVIHAHDSPVTAVRQKKDSSLMVGLRLVKDGQADALVSAGNTGALHVAARTVLGPIKGVARSAIGTLVPTARKPVLLLDMGANVDCSARHLCEFAEMGMVYSARALGVRSPRVGLLNIGREQAKGNELAKAVHRSLSAADHINFIGNVEPMALYEGAADVVVCDGFVGNVFLKTSEAAGHLLTTLIKRELDASWISKLGALLCRGAFKRVAKTHDSNEYVGASILGINGVVVKVHGASKGRGVANGIFGACGIVSNRVPEHIKTGMEELRRTEAILKQQENSE
ncbi:MAG TPA: phosphate acyltransferase PlsX [Candidatus Hydrogenedentes bacterium]|nr:phosphate acyltransferase PlsX [Candidatus Hydrogenedentota bacterium]HIJ74137.1 phosphate acyltransferase PlsX [Candidatus Hydrogenedentota bacterium]